MLEVFDFTVSYTLDNSIDSLCIIISISLSECLLIYVLDISKTFENTILTNPGKGSILFYHIYTWNSSKENGQNIHELQGLKSLRDPIHRRFFVDMYLPTGSEHYKLFSLHRSHGSTNHQKPSNDKHIKNDEKRVS